MKILSFLFSIVLFLNFALLITCLSTLTFAQETVETLPNIVVTATRVEESPHDVSQDITVITKDDIEKRRITKRLVVAELRGALPLEELRQCFSKFFNTRKL